MTKYTLTYLSILLILTACGNAIEEVSTLTPNLDPVANDDVLTVYRNSSNVEIDVLANDKDPEGVSLSITSFTTGQFGSVTKSINEPEGILVYQPELNQSGKDTFNYTVRDSLGKTSDAKVTVNVSAWSAPIEVGKGTDIEFAVGLDGTAIAIWKNRGSIFGNRFLPGIGWQTAIPIYTTGLAGSITTPQLAVSSVGKVLMVWQIIENASTVFGYSLLVNSQWQTITKPWLNGKAGQIKALDLSLIDNQGMASLVWSQKRGVNNNTIWQNSITPQGYWSDQDTLITQAQINAQSPVSVTQGDRTAVVWLQDSPKTVWWRYKSNKAWELPAVPLSDPTQQASNVQVSMGQMGKGLVLWQAKDNSATIRLNARTFTYLDGGIPVLDQAFAIDNGFGDVSNAQLVKNVTGDTVIVWRQLSTEGAAIWTFRILGSSRILEKVSENDNKLPGNPTVSFNEDGEIFVLWFEGEQLLSRKFETTWQPIETLTSSLSLSAGRSISVGSDGLGNAVAVWNTSSSQSSIWSSDYCNNPIDCQINTSTHQMVNQACVDCHNGTASTGKSAIHMPTTDMCESCHLNTVAWVPVLGSAVDHSQVITLNCISCHDGVLALGKGDVHISTTDVCEACHVNTTWVPAIFPLDHFQVIGVCEDCHYDGGPATGPGTIHDPLCPNFIDFTCGDCHNTIDWGGADPNGLCVAATGTAPTPPPPSGGGMMGGGM